MAVKRLIPRHGRPPAGFILDVMIIRTLLLALLPTVALCAPMVDLPPDAKLVDSVDPVLAERAGGLGLRVQELLASSDAASAIAVLSTEGDPLLAELAAAEVIDALRTRPASAAARGLVEWLALQPDRVYRRHEETAGDWYLPLLGIAARAEGTLLLWRHAEERAAWAERLSRPSDATWADLERVSGDEAERAAEALLQLDTRSYATFRASAPTHALPAPVWLAIATRSPDRDSYDRAWAVSDGRQRLLLVERAADALPAADAVRWLAQATEAPEVASAALLAVASLSEREPAARAVLLRALDDPAFGPSAAAGLARGAADGRAERIAALLDAGASEIKARHLVLALRLDASPAAHDVLRRWAHDSRLPDTLRRELQP
jgi:hypothetical protein